VITFLNPAPGRKDLERRLLPLTDIICINQNETEFITGLTLKTFEEFKDAAIQILEYGPKIVSSFVLKEE
jgi:pyridoxal/pyridoxine/pyridoxamine kinase